MVGDNKYYLNINDQNVGPLSFEEIAERIKNGLLNPEDYIFVEGQKDWQTVKDLPEFSHYLEPEDPALRKTWFIRRNRQNEGPYSKEEILGMIEAGTTDINDYIWGKELRNWTTIKDAFMLSEKTVDKPTEIEPTVENKSVENKSADNKPTDDTPVDKISAPPQTKKRMLPEFIFGIALILVGLYQAPKNLITAIIVSFFGAALLIISFNENKKT